MRGPVPTADVHKTYDFDGVKLFVLMFAGFLTAVPVIAASNEWLSIGPEGGAVNAVVVNPLSPAVVYAATSGGGVFKSVDSGVSWRAVNSGLRTNPSYGSTAPDILALAIDPVNPSTLYAAVYQNGVFKTVNGGATWTPTLSSFNDQEPAVTGLAVDSSNPLRVYAVSALNFQIGIFVTSDGGKTWAGTSAGGAAVIVDPGNPGTAYVGGGIQTYTGVLKTTDGGATWAPTGAGPSEVRSLAIDTKDSSLIYAGTSGGILFRSTDGGGSWALTGSGLPESPILALGHGPLG